MRDHGLDSVRGLAILLVMGGHLFPLAVLGSGREASLANIVSGLFGAYVHPIAVPAFYLVSLILYFRRPSLKRRLSHIILVACFWIGVQYLLYVLVRHQVPPLDFHTLRIGGPSLRAHGLPTVFWFLIDLPVLLCVAELFRRVQAQAPRVANALGLLLLVSSLGFFLAVGVAHTRYPHWLLANFMLYVPIAWWIEQGRAVRTLAPWLCGFLCMCALEFTAAWLMPSVGPVSVSSYSRLSVVAGAILLVLWGLGASRHPMLEWLGERSLGVYAIHDTVYVAALALIPTLSFGSSRITLQLSLIPACAAVATTIALVYAMERTPLAPLVGSRRTQSAEARFEST